MSSSSSFPTDSGEESPALKIYLDQSVYGHMLDAEKGDWKRGELARVLLEARDKGVAEVWVGPTHVVETVLAAPEKRTKIAAVMLDLIDAKRVWWGHEIEALLDFLNFATEWAPDAVRFPQFLQRTHRQRRQVWLGALGLMAAAPRYSADDLVASLKHLKATNRLIHARFAADPADWIARMLDAVENMRTTDRDVFADFDKMTEEQLNSEVSELELQVEKLGSALMKKLNDNRAKIASAYGAIEIGSLLHSTFTLPMELTLFFDIPHMVSSWSRLQSLVGSPPLSPEVLGANQGQLACDPRLARSVLQQAVLAFARADTVTTFIGFEVILRELQKRCNDRKTREKTKEVETGGLAFDAEHAVAIARFDVVMTHDTILAASLKTIATALEKQSNGALRCAVVSNARQLEAAINRARPATP